MRDSVLIRNLAWTLFRKLVLPSSLYFHALA